MSIIVDKINSLNLKVEDIKIYKMSEIKLGMQVDNSIRPIYIKHIPSDITVISKEHRTITQEFNERFRKTSTKNLRRINNA